MISANEIRNRQIKVSQVGYDKEEVNILLDEAADTVDGYVAENKELYHKLEVLANKIEEYRAEEDSIKSALITAQKMADQIKKESAQAAEDKKKRLTKKREKRLTMLTSALKTQWTVQKKLSTPQNQRPKEFLNKQMKRLKVLLQRKRHRAMTL